MRRRTPKPLLRGSFIPGLSRRPYGALNRTSVLSLPPLPRPEHVTSVRTRSAQATRARASAAAADASLRRSEAHRPRMLWELWSNLWIPSCVRSVRMAKSGVKVVVSVGVRHRAHSSWSNTSCRYIEASSLNISPLRPTRCPYTSTCRSLTRHLLSR